MSEDDPHGSWVCGAVEDGRDCGAVITGRSAERLEHIRTAHPGHYGVLYLPLKETR